jgi:hypothetical protein
MENYLSHLYLGNDEQTTQKMERNAEAPDHPGSRAERPDRDLAHVKLNPFLISAMDESLYVSLYYYLVASIDVKIIFIFKLLPP